MWLKNNVDRFFIYKTAKNNGFTQKINNQDVNGLFDIDMTGCINFILEPETQQLYQLA